jgi:hypothetical protein
VCIPAAYGQRTDWYPEGLHGVKSMKWNYFTVCPYEIKKTLWPESASELYRSSDGRLSAKLLPTFLDKGCKVVSVKDPYGRILGFLDQSRYFLFQVAPQFY